MTDVIELRKVFEKSGMPIAEIARRSGILRETLYNRMSTDKCDFKASEISGLTKALNLTKTERDKIFFAE